MVKKSETKKSKTISKKTSISRSKKIEESDQPSGIELLSPVTKPKVEAKQKEVKIAPRPISTGENHKHTYSDTQVPPLEQAVEIKSEDEHFEVQAIPARAFFKNKSEPEYLNLKLSHSLIRKLREQSADEGISLEEFVTELLSESVVLRAWEIVERKNQMKGGNNSSSLSIGNNRNSGQNGNATNNNRGNGQRSNKGHRGMSHMRYQTIMEDKATFLEYVRNQERNRR